MISEAQAKALIAELQAGWNAGNGEAFAAPFAEDADFVTVAGQHARGRQAIADNHNRIFSTIYKGSRVSMTLAQLRPLGDGLALMHIAPTLEVPEGPMAGTMDALMTTVVDDRFDRPQIVALHNVIVRDLAQAAGVPAPAKEATT